MEVLMELAREMRKEPQFSLLILEDPEMLGVDAFADSAVVIKFIVRTRPLKQWIVRRELLRRIKNRFDELGIEIPFPHRTLYHRGLEEPLSVQLSNGVGETGHQGEDGGRR
jgi:small conductance mechanosensitive channel